MYPRLYSNTTSPCHPLPILTGHATSNTQRLVANDCAALLPRWVLVIPRSQGLRYCLHHHWPSRERPKPRGPSLPANVLYSWNKNAKKRAGTEPGLGSWWGGATAAPGPAAPVPEPGGPRLRPACFRPPPPAPGQPGPSARSSAAQPTLGLESALWGLAAARAACPNTK